MGSRLKTLNKLTLQSTLAGLAVTLISVAAAGQELSASPVLIITPQVRGTTLAPNFRVTAFRLETSDSDEDSVAPDVALDTSSSSSSEQRQGLVKPSIDRIAADQKRLYLARSNDITSNGMPWFWWALAHF